jgi:hypothetical protein
MVDLMANLSLSFGQRMVIRIETIIAKEAKKPAEPPGKSPRLKGRRPVPVGD